MSRLKRREDESTYGIKWWGQGTRPACESRTTTEMTSELSCQGRLRGGGKLTIGQRRSQNEKRLREARRESS